MFERRENIMSKRRVLAVCLVVLLAGAVTAALATGPRVEKLRPSVAEINRAIAAKGECWVAGENKFSRKTPAQLKKMLGAMPINWSDIEKGPADEVMMDEDLAELAAKPGPTLPAAFDWRTSDGVTSVKDQGDCGSCWAFGSVAQVEALNKIYKGTTLDLSEQFIVSCETDNYGCDGGYMDRVYNFLKSTGTPDESCFPYKATDLACSNSCSDWAARVTKISSWTWVCKTRPNTTAIKTAIYSSGPITASFDVYYDFFSYTSGCYKHVTGAFAGGHAVLVVGWTSDGCWIVKNSWGQNWGEQGYFKIKFGDCSFGRSSGKFVIS